MTAESSSTRDLKAYLESFREYLKREGLKSTRQREIIVREFGSVEGHASVEELLARVRRLDGGLGYATVYRTLKLLVDAGLAGARNFGEGFARYEPTGDSHHDHLICDHCGKIVEFHDAELERLQEVVASGLGFRIVHHRHELFGICADCRATGVRAHGAGPATAADDLPTVFRRYLAREGMRVTRQRIAIAGVFAAVEDHVSVDDLLARVKKVDSTVGYATVYRTLKLLVDAGLASVRQFGDGFHRYEPRPEEHHDHFVNELTSEVLEFHDEAIEHRQEQIARQHGYLLTRHRHDLFGVPVADGSAAS